MRSRLVPLPTDRVVDKWGFWVYSIEVKAWVAEPPEQE